MEPLAFTAYLGEIAVVHDPIEEGGNSGCIAEEHRPIFKRSLRRRDGGSGLVAAHHQFEQSRRRKAAVCASLGRR